MVLLNFPLLTVFDHGRRVSGIPVLYLYLLTVRASLLAEILADNPDVEDEERWKLMHTINREAERLSRLITLVLDLEKFEFGKATLDCTL